MRVIPPSICGRSPARTPATAGRSATPADHLLSQRWHDLERADRPVDRLHHLRHLLVDDNNCFASGSGGRHVRHHQRRGTWRHENSSTTQDLHRICCPSASDCRAVGSVGTIVATTTAAATLVRADLQHDPVAVGIDCADTNLSRGRRRRHARGDQRRRRSAPAAPDWVVRTRAVGGRYTLYSASCASDSDCWAIGDAGTIFRDEWWGDVVDADVGDDERLRDISCVANATGEHDQLCGGGARRQDRDHQQRGVDVDVADVRPGV